MRINGKFRNSGTGKQLKDPRAFGIKLEIERKQHSLGRLYKEEVTSEISRSVANGPYPVTKSSKANVK